MSKELAADYFSRHTSDECHITSDNRVFHTLGSAQGFAAGLKDNNVSSYKRADIEAPTTELESTDEVGEKEARFKQRVDTLIELGFERVADDFIKESGNVSISAHDVLESSDEDFDISKSALVDFTPKDDNSKPNPLVLLKNFDPETAEYPQVKELYNALGLQAPSNKKPDLLAAIEAYKIANIEVNK
jgi:hypothetical protein